MGYGSGYSGGGGGSASSAAVGDITGLGTGVGTALAINVGSAGAPVVLNGALGTPSSGVLGACTGGALVSYLATTVTYNNVDVLANTALSVTVVASGIYKISLEIQSTAVARPLKLDFAGSATIANFIGQWTSMGATDPVNAGAAAPSAAAGTDFVGSDAAESFTTFNGSVEITNAGTFLLRGSQDTANASNTTILRGSTLTLTKMN
jgi:hypothetical protein